MKQPTHWRIATHKAVVLAALCAAGLPLTASAQKGKGGGGGADQDITVCVGLAGPSLGHEGVLTGDLLGEYCDSDRSTTAFAGRRRTITLALGSNRNQARRFYLHLGERLPDVPGDPDPNTDGGPLSQSTPGDWSEHPIPEFPQGVVGEAIVAYIENVQHMGEPGGDPNPLICSGRIQFFDEQGLGWGLYWGDQFQSYGTSFVNTTTSKGVQITRLDAGGTLLNEWEVTTLPDDHLDLPAGRQGECAAFLWRQYANGETNGDDYFGVFDVWFSWDVYAE